MTQRNTWVVQKGIALAAMVTLGACAETPEAADPFGGAPWFTDGPELRIGAVDDPVFSFSSVRGMEVGPDGLIYSLHFNEAAIRRWTQDGQPAGTIGREGEGPGEFQRPVSLGFFGDTLWVMDSRAYRLSYFDLDGSYLGGLTPEIDLGTPDDGPGSPPRPNVPLRDGTFLGSGPAWSHEIALGELTQTPFVHMDAEGKTLSTLWRHPWETRDILALIREDGRGGTYGTQPFGDDVQVAMVDDGLVVVDRRAWEGGEGVPTFSVTRMGLAGDTLFRSRIGYAPIPLPRERVDSAVRARAENLHGFMSRGEPGLALGAVEQDVAEAIYAPAYLPAVRSLLIADDGDIWLQRFEPLQREGQEPMTEWLILSASGAPKARAMTPRGLTVQAITGESIYGVESDEFDVNYIVRYRLVKES